MLRALDFKERTRIRRALYAKPTILTILALTFISLSGAWNMYQKSRVAKANDEKATAELVALQVREAGLRSDIDRLSTTRGQEEEIRDRFMVAKDGEKVIIILSTHIVDAGNLRSLHVVAYQGLFAWPLGGGQSLNGAMEDDQFANHARRETWGAFGPLIAPDAFRVGIEYHVKFLVGAAQKTH